MSLWRYGFSSFAVLLVGVFVCWSCASHTQLSAPMREAMYDLDLPAAFEYLETSSHLTSDGKNRLLYFLEKARLLHHMGRLGEAEKAYLRAAKLADELYTTSLSQAALSFVVNDSTMDYAGEEHELVAIHAMLALLFLEQGLLDKARVEAKRVGTRLKELASGGVKKADSYSIDAFALFLSGMIFEALGEYDNAIVDYRKAYDLYKKKYLGIRLVPRSLLESFYQTALKDGRRDLVSKLRRDHFGLASLREEVSPAVMVIAIGYPVSPKISKSFVFAAGKTVIRYSWPSIAHRDTPFPSYDMQFAKLGEVNLEVVQNYDEIARRVLEEKRLRLTAKSLTRLVAKAKIAHEVQKVNPILGLITSIFGAWMETADTRAWTLLPAKIAVRRVSLPKGASSWNYRARGAMGFYSGTLQVGGRRSGSKYRQSMQKSASLSFLTLDYTRNASFQRRMAALMMSSFVSKELL